MKYSAATFREKIGQASLKILGNEKYDKNQFCSPFSIQSALGMLLSGTNGNTKSQIEDTLFSAWKSGTEREKRVQPHQSLFLLTNEVSKPYKEGNNTFNIANRLYIQNDFEITSAFKSSTEKCYDADAHNVDFTKSEETRKEINKWVEKKTMNKIEELLPKNSLSSNTKLVLINAIYFYGSWKYEFNASLTKKQDFKIYSTGSKKTLKSKGKVRVDMMSQAGNFTFCRLEGIAAEILKLDYTEERLSMLIILPNKDDGLAEVSKSMGKFNYTTCVEKSFARKAEIFVPKFEIKAEYQMKKILSEAGMTDVFDSNKADLSGIAKGGKGGHLFVDEVYHQAFVSVNEKGTEAAAATGIVVTTKSGPKTFKCDHPFLFMIVENQFGNVLFEGSLSNPSVGLNEKK